MEKQGLIQERSTPSYMQTRGKKKIKDAQSKTLYNMKNTTMTSFANKHIQFQMNNI